MSAVLSLSGRRRRERQTELDNLLSGPMRQPIESPYIEPQTHSENGRDGSSINSTTPDCDNSGVPVERTWLDDADPTRLPESFDFSFGFSPSDSSWQGSETIPMELNDFLQVDEVLNATFADDFQIAVPELDLLRAAYEIAGRVQSTQLLFDINAQSVFHSSDCSRWISALPRNLQPTRSQLITPHHPLIDILPWPGVRTKLIHMYSLPCELWPRHPSDRTESSLIRLVYDMEDGGIRVTGPDPSEEGAWEIEQRFFDAWWWAMDQSTVCLTNKKRLARGQSQLCTPMTVH